MPINKRIILFTFIIFFSVQLFAQEIVRQRLSWSVEHAFRYEVILQMMERGSFVPHLAESTTEQFLDVSLHPGFYRFLVIPYDVLDRPSKESDWVYFYVITQKGFEEDFDKDKEKPKEKEPWEIYEEFSPVIFKIGTAWVPIKLIHGDDFKDFYPMSAQANIAIIMETTNSLHIGAEMFVLIYSLSPMSTPLKDFKYNADLVVNMLAVKWLSGERIGLVMKAGAAFPLEPSDRNVGVNFGMSIYWRLLNKLIMETGCDYTRSFSNGFIRPYIGFAFIF